MKVYVVTKTGCSDSWIDAIFLSEEKAISYTNQRGGCYFGNFDIEEYQTLDDTIDSNALCELRYVYYYVQRYNDDLMRYVDDVELEFIAPTHDVVCSNDTVTVNNHTIKVTLDTMDDEKAYKLALEEFFKRKRERKGEDRLGIKGILN